MIGSFNSAYGELASGELAPLPLRVLVLTRDALFARDFLRGLLSESEGAGAGTVPPFQIVGVGVSTRALRRGAPGRVAQVADILQWVRKVGVRYAVYIAWVAHLAPLLMRVSPSPAQVAARAGAPHLRISDVNAPDTLRWIEALQPDVVLSAHWNQWIAPETLAQVRFGGINVHPSILPADRGVDPVHVALRRGATELGCSLHRVVPRLDEGDLLAQHRCPVLPGGRVPNNRALFRAAGGLAREVLSDLEGALARAWPQPTEGASYHGWDAVRK